MTAVERVREYAIARGDNPDAEERGFLAARRRMRKRIKRYLKRYEQS